MVLRLIQIRLATPSLEKSWQLVKREMSGAAWQAWFDLASIRGPPNRWFKFQKRRQLFIRTTKRFPSRWASAIQMVHDFVTQTLLASAWVWAQHGCM